MPPRDQGFNQHLVEKEVGDLFHQRHRLQSASWVEKEVSDLFHQRHRLQSASWVEKEVSDLFH